MELARSSTGSAYASSVDDLGDAVTDCEILTLLRFTANYNHHMRIVARGSGANEYFAYMQPETDAVGIHKYTPGSASVGTASKTIDLDTWYWGRFRLASTTLRFRVWEMGTPEPSAWDVDQTDSSLSSGWVGVGTNATSTLAKGDFDYYAVSTDGSTVPVPSDPLSIKVTQHALLVGRQDINAAVRVTQHALMVGREAANPAVRVTQHALLVGRQTPKYAYIRVAQKSGSSTVGQSEWSETVRIDMEDF